jgi:ABC-2 type transport system ATP-binding protein
MSDFAIETQHLRRRFGEKLAVADLEPERAARRGVRLPGPERRRQDHVAQDAAGADRAHGGHAARSWARHWASRGARARVGFLPEHFRFQDWLTGREFLHFHGRLYGLSAARSRRRRTR